MPVFSEFPTVPEIMEPLNERLQNAIFEVANKNPQKTAYINAEDETIRITYKELYYTIQCLSTFLDSINFRKGDVAAIILNNCWEYVAFFIAVISQGGIITSANPTATQLELEKQLADAEPKLTLIEEESLEKTFKRARNPFIETVVIIPKTGSRCVNCRKPEKQTFYWCDAIKQIPTPKLNTPQDVVNDVVFLPYSSGTTGLPKGVMLTHKNFGTSLRIFQRHIDKLLKSLDPNWDWFNEHMIYYLPFYHIYGCGLILHALLQGVTAIVFRRFIPQKYCRVIQDYKVKVLWLVPPTVVFLAKSPLTIKYDLSSVLLAFSGAAPLSEDICRMLKQRLTTVKCIAQGYGATECSMASHLPVIDSLQKCGSCGKLISNLQSKIVDTETGHELSLEEKGEICIKGSTVMLGYYKNSVVTDETIDKDGWLHTGDIGYNDKEGFLYVVDRIKELIKVCGFQVPPAELEELLLSHPFIVDVAVIGVPDKFAGEVPRAYVVKGIEELTEADVTEYLKGRVSPYKYLTGGVCFVQQLPKSQSGKILRRILQERAISDISLNAQL